MRVFLDVGANEGQTLDAVQEKDFDRIYCFEPCSVFWPELEARADRRTRVERFGLWDRSGEAVLQDAGTKGGSIWTKNNRAPGQKEVLEVCEFRRASDWFVQNISREDRVWMKLNCEGAECDILDDLIDSGEFDKVTYCMVVFDVHKIDTMKHREEEILKRLKAYPPPRVMTKEVMVGRTHRDRIHRWLSLVPA